jgi:hypothetical protein
MTTIDHHDFDGALEKACREITNINFHLASRKPPFIAVTRLACGIPQFFSFPGATLTELESNAKDLLTAGDEFLGMTCCSQMQAALRPPYASGFGKPYVALLRATGGAIEFRPLEGRTAAAAAATLPRSAADVYIATTDAETIAEVLAWCSRPSPTLFALASVAAISALVRPEHAA